MKGESGDGQNVCEKRTKRGGGGRWRREILLGIPQCYYVVNKIEDGGCSDERKWSHQIKLVSVCFSVSVNRGHYFMDCWF